MEQFIYLITTILYGVFIIRFILSWVGADFDLDADADLDISDVVSFKGITHFLMGSFTWLSTKLYTTHNIEWYDYLIAFGLGIMFVMILFWVYKLMMSLESNPNIKIGRQLVGHAAVIYLYMGKKSENVYKYIIVTNNGVGSIEYPAQSDKSYSIGDPVTILDYKNSHYII